MLSFAINRLRVLVPSALVLVASACDPVDTETESCSRDDTNACCCFSEVDSRHEVDGGAIHVSNACGTVDLCPELTLLCPGQDERVDCDFTEATIENEAALDCMLDALADGKSGRISWYITEQEARGWAYRSHELYLFDEAEAIHSSSHTIDLGFWHKGAEHWQLRSRGEFATCRDATDSASRLECLFRPAAETAAVCVPPYDPERSP